MVSIIIKRRRWIIPCLLCLSLLGCTSKTPPPVDATPSATLLLTKFLDGLTRPVLLTHAGDGTNRLFLLEQKGRILLVREGKPLPTPFLDLTDIVKSSGTEQGLLGLTFHPNFVENGRFFVHYTGASGETVIARYNRSATNPDQADPASGQIILTVPQPYANHNGGTILIGPDGYLYIALGDGGSAGDPQGNAQNLESLLGKILRIDINTEQGYRIPADNPFVGQPGRDEIWSYGLRNPWRISFDRVTGDLYIADVGQSKYEEINLQPAGTGGGQNYGWNIFEGMNRYRQGVLPNQTPPIAQYGHDKGCSITGGYVYRGRAIPTLVGRYLYGDYCSGRIWALQRKAGEWVSEQLLASNLRISSFGEDEAGEIYLIDHGGAVYRLSLVPAQ